PTTGRRSSCRRSSASAKREAPRRESRRGAFYFRTRDLADFRAALRAELRALREALAARRAELRPRRGAGRRGVRVHLPHDAAHGLPDAEARAQAHARADAEAGRAAL